MGSVVPAFFGSRSSGDVRADSLIANFVETAFVMTLFVLYWLCACVIYGCPRYNEPKKFAVLTF